MIMTITRNSHDYNCIVTHDGDVFRITVVDADGNERQVATAEKDHAVQQVFASYTSEENGAVDIECPSELFYLSAGDICTWLIDGLYN